VQNVIERLRGIDRRSQFKTARIDGSFLETLLSEHPKLLEKVFGDQQFEQRGLGTPDAMILPSDGSTQSAPLYIPIRLKSSNSSNAATVEVRAMIDTGASVTCIPLPIIESLGLSPTGVVQVATPHGHSVVKRYDVQIEIERLGNFTVAVVGLEMDTALLGRDILSRFSILIHADGGMSFYKK
jgi:hypothetical protein